MVPNPAHSGCESWLQSVWAVGRHLSQYSSAVDAFAAHGTCKQPTPQITVVWVVHGEPHCSVKTLMQHVRMHQSVAWHIALPQYGPKIATLSLCIALKVLLHIKARHSATKQHGGSLPGNVTARAGGQSRGRSTTAKHLSSTDSVGPAQTEMIPFRVDPRESMHMARQFISNPGATRRLARGYVGASYLY
jgi:hypothetical protein